MAKNEIHELRAKLNKTHKAGMKVVKEQQNRIAKLEKYVAQDKKEMAKLQKRITSLESKMKLKKTKS